MNERQNADGTWSEAVPIKASWETNRLLQFFKKFKKDRQVKLTMKKNNEIPVVKYEKWLPYCQDAFGFTKSFKCSKCDCVTEMPVLSDLSIAYYAYCPHCGSAMLHRVDE